VTDLSTLFTDNLIAFFSFSSHVLSVGKRAQAYIRRKAPLQCKKGWDGFSNLVRFNFPPRFASMLFGRVGKIFFNLCTL